MDMAEIKALDELREWAEQFCSMGKHDPLMFADKIQAEVDERFMELPLDGNGVPIRVGDVVAEKPFRPKTGEKPAEVVCMLLNSDGWAIGDCDPRGHWYGPLQLEHVKPRTIEDVLTDLTNEVAKQGHQIGLTAGEIIAKYADEIRELAKEGK
jgi:hypothetical protein